MQNIEDAEIVKSLLSEGNQLQEEGKLDLAVEKYSEALQVNPESVAALNQLAGLYESRKEFERAINYYQQVVQLIPRNAMAHAKLARAMMRQRNIPGAITVYQKAVTLKKKHPAWVYLGLGNALREDKQADQAIAIYQQGMEFEPNNPTFHLKVAQLFFDQGNFDSAIDSYETAIKLKPEKPEQLYNNLTKALTKLGRLDQIISTYRSLIEIDPDLEEEGHSNLGQVLVQLGIQQGQLDSVVHFLEEAIESQPNIAWLYYYLATALVKQGKINKALILYQQTIKLNPEFYLAYIELGKLLIQKGNLNETLQCCVSSLQINPKDVNTYILCQRWLEKFHPRLSSQHFEIMEEAYKNAAIHIQDSKPHLIRLYINMGNLLKRQGKLSEAILCNQDASYHTIIRTKPSFIKNNWSSSKQKEPDFMIIGVMKCGTTSLFLYLLKHPNILPSIQKETSYLSGLVKQKKLTLSSDSKLEQSDRNWYLSYFSPRPESGKFLTGEASNEYIFTKGVEKIVFNNFPKTKLIVMLRNPVKRAISQYHMLVKQGREFRSLEDTFKSELELLEGITDFTEVIDKYSKSTSYLSHGLYIYFLERWMRLFSQKQLLILRSEDLRKKPREVIKQAFDFLGLPDYQKINCTTHNQGNYSSQIDQDLLSQLYNFYRPHNQKLEEYFGINFYWE